MVEMTKNEEIVLLTVWRLEDNAYGVTIKNQVKVTTSKEWNYGTLYCTLDQLVKKGLLVKQEGQPLSERGGRRKIFYQLTKEGIRGLQHARAMYRALWNGLKPLEVI